MNDTTPITAQSESLRPIAQAAVQLPGVESTAIFTVDKGSPDLKLRAAAGVDGVPLQRLADAVRNPAHPIARTASTGDAEFDVIPMAPGGPALRSHLPLVAERGGSPVVVGVLAVAHEASLDPAVKRALAELAAAAAALIASP